LSDNVQVEIKLKKGKFQGSVQLDQSVPESAVLIPRGIGIPVDGPEDVVLKAKK
jgi:hypothetical protein